MKEIVIITTGWFPEGDAGAVRLLMMSKALTASGYHVTALCRGKVNDKGTVDGIDYLSLRHLSSTAGKVFDMVKFPARVKSYLKERKDSLHGVYIYNAHISVFKFCKKFCKENGIKLVHDCVEWYSPEEFKLGKLSHDYRVKNSINTKIIDKSFSVIAISRFLEDHFKSKGIKTLRVPVLCDSSKRQTPKAENGDKLTLFYGGLPGTKDLVGNIMKAAALLTKEEQSRLKLVFVGTTREYLINKCYIEPSVIDSCEGMLELCGRVPRAEVLERMEKADFSLLARDASLRYAKAGFPSKVVEALANATPMLCNISSDLDLVLSDGENAIIAKSHDPRDLAEAISRAIKLTPEEKNAMSRNALDTAARLFDYNAYSEKLAEFFE